MEKGYIKLSRSLTENWLWTESEFSKGQAWIDLLMRANYLESKTLIAGQLITIKPGETIWSLKGMAERWGWSRNKVSRFLDLLESESMVEQERNGYFTKITVKNWQKFQTNETQTRRKRDSDEIRTDTNKESIKKVKEKSVYKKPKVQDNKPEERANQKTVDQVREKLGFHKPRIPVT